MPARRGTQRNENEGRGSLPPPPTDTATRILESMAQYLERAQNASSAQPDMYERFRKLNPKAFSGTIDPFEAEVGSDLWRFIFDS